MQQSARNVQQAREIQKAQKIEKATWTAEEAADLAVNSALQSKKYYELTTARVSDVRSDIDTISFSQEMESKRVTRLERRVASVEAQARNQAIVWGAVSAMITGIFVAFILAPSSAPRPQTQGVQNVR